MTHEYKIGEKVLVEMNIFHKDGLGNFYVNLCDRQGYAECFLAKPHEIRPYTPRQEFEYGEEVEVDEYGNGKWIKAKFIGTSHNNLSRFKYFANKISEEGVSLSYLSAIGCRKLTTKKETLTIGGVDYYKDDVEKALRDLKPIKGGV